MYYVRKISVLQRCTLLGPYGAGTWPLHPEHQGCGAGTGTGRNRINLETLEPEPEPYSEYGSGSGSEYKEMKQTTQKN